MFFFEKYFTLVAFAIGWGCIVALDFILRMIGIAGYHGIQTGVIFPFAAPVMSALVIFAFGYFLSNRGELGKKFYASCNFLMLLVLTTALIIDFILRFVAFDQTYCRGMDAEGFAACKDEHRDMLWLDLIKLAAAIRMMIYS